MSECFSTISDEVSTTYYARKDQTLRRHLSNMIQQVPHITSGPIEIPSIEQPGTYLSIQQNDLQYYLSLVFAIHDFGKCSRVFQKKIQRLMDPQIPTLDNNCVAFSYHIQTGALVGYCLFAFLEPYWVIENNQLSLKLDTIQRLNKLDQVINKIVESDDHEWIWKMKEKLETNSAFYARCLTVIGSLAVLMHHDKDLHNDTERLETVGGYPIEEIVFHIAQDFVQTGCDFDGIYTDLLDHSSWNWVVATAIGRFLQLGKTEVSNLIEGFTNHILGFIRRLDQYQQTIRSAYSVLFSFVYSGLCEVDEWDAKSYILDTENHYIPFSSQRIEIGETIVDVYRSKQFGIEAPRFISEISSTPEDILNNIRNRLYAAVDQMVDKVDIKELRSSIFLIDAPTGAAKTLALLNFANKLRSKMFLNHGDHPKIIYSLPFISIVEQVGGIVTDILTGAKLFPTPLPEDYQFDQSQLLTLHHHLADSRWLPLETQEEGTIVKSEDVPSHFHYHFVNTWHSEIVVTSFVKLFNTILKGHKREFIRFHRLKGAIILIDEIQGIPAQYWLLISEVLEGLVRSFGCTIVMASATSPRSLLAPTLRTHNIFSLPSSVNQLLNRYTVQLDCFTDYGQRIDIDLQEFFDLIVHDLQSIRDKSVMIVLNTTRTAFSIYHSLSSILEKDVYLLSSKVLPVHRKKLLEELSGRLKEGKRTILVCTQVIEAGVDVSFELVYRDFCPLDSLVQVAGRCNRNFEFDELGIVKLVSLKAPKNGTRYTNMTYQSQTVNISITDDILSKHEGRSITEPELRELVGSYYNRISQQRRINELVKAYRLGQFGTMYEKFNLIKEKKIVAIIMQSKENKQLVKKYYREKKLKHIPNKMLKYTLEVTEKDLERILIQIDDHHYKTIKSKYTDDPFYIIYLDRIEHPETIYSKQSGLVMDNILKEE